jgi:aminopeptidase N
LSVHSSCTAAHKTNVTLRQQRFFAGQPAPTPGQQELWQIPACLRVRAKETCQLLTTSDQSSMIDACGPAYANSGAVGYYRSFYDSDTLQSLAAGAESTLSPAERMNLVNDAWTAARTGRSKVGDFLSMVKLMSDEPEPSVLKSFAADLAYVNDYIVADSDRGRYTEWIRATFGARVRSIEWESLVHVRNAALQIELLNIVGGIGRDPQLLRFSRGVTAEAGEARERNNPLLAATVQIGYHNGHSSLYEALLTRMRSSKNPQEHIECLQSLAQFENPQLVQRSLTLDTSGELNVGEARALRSFLFQNPAARSASWEFLKHHWDEVEKKDLVTRGLFGDLGQFCDPTIESQIQEFFHLHKLPDELMQPLAESLSTIGECSSLKARMQPNLHTWLSGISTLPGN